MALKVAETQMDNISFPIKEQRDTELQDCMLLAEGVNLIWTKTLRKYPWLNAHILEILFNLPAQKQYFFLFYNVIVALFSYTLLAHNDQL